MHKRTIKRPTYCEEPGAVRANIKSCATYKIKKKKKKRRVLEQGRTMGDSQAPLVAS